MSTGPWHIPYENWDATISATTVDAAGSPRAGIDPSGSEVIKLLWDTFDLTPGLDIVRARITFRVVGAAAPDGVCLVVAWNRDRPFSTDDWSATPGSDALAAVGMAEIISKVGQSYTLDLDNASGLTRCTTGVVIGFEPVGAVAGINYLEIEGFSTGVSAQLSLIVRQPGGDEDDYNTGGQNPDGTEGEENQEAPKHTAAKLNRELALRSERLGASRLRPEVEYSTRLRAEGSVRVLQ